MATPTRSQAVSTPKNPLTSTPNRSNASPRPNTGAFSNKPFAYKSPAVKTPASGHGHRTLHPTSTPLTAAAIPDELLNLSSPGAAALIASMGQTGLTPIPAAQDGLGISTGITPSQTRDGSTGAIRDPLMERMRRLKEVADTLRKGAVGSDVNGPNVEQLAQIHGFETFWDENTMQLAGNAVDLEITFDSDKTSVLKTALKLNMPDEEGQLQEDASRVLMNDLSKIKEDQSGLPWKSLDNFAANLSYLDHMDHLGSTGNCFQLVGHLYDTFRRIWDEEKKRMKLRHDVHHQCQSNVGLPLKDTDGKLGVRSRYWARGQPMHQNSTQAEQNGGSHEQSTADDWVAEFTCEKGDPSVPFDHDWLADDPLLNSLTAENLFQDSQVDKPNWQDPMARSPNERKASNAMDIDETAISQIRMLDVHFSCKLQPAVILPLHIISTLNSQSNIITIEQHRAMILQQVLPRLQDHEKEHHTEIINEARWLRSVDSFNKDGSHRKRNHSYAFYVTGAPWVYSVNQFNFTHPRQFSELIPVLRQYALVGTLLASLEYQGVRAPPPEKQTPTNQSITKRGNKANMQKKLNLTLRLAKTEEEALPVDVRIDIVSDVTKVKLEFCAPLSKQHTRPGTRPFLRVSVEVRMNGILEVTDIDGIDPNKKKSLSRKLGKVLALSEDIGVSMEWLFRELKN